MDQTQSAPVAQGYNEQQIDNAIANLPGISTDSGTQTNDNPQDSAVNQPQQPAQTEDTTPTIPESAPAPDEDKHSSSNDSYLGAISKESSPSPSANTDNDDNLQHIKDEALEKLRPLVDKLDQEPEEKFDTLLMLIRASDDKSLIKPAYEAAEEIKDDHKRAKALLDVVNEVNYLTQPHESSKSA